MEEPSLPAYQRRTKAADALIAGAYLPEPTRAGCAALKAFRGEVGKDWSAGLAQVKGDWTHGSPLANGRTIIRLILDGTVCACGSTRSHVDFTARRAGRARGRQKVLLRSRYGARARPLAGVARRSRQTRIEDAELVIVDGAPGLEKRWRHCGRMFRPALHVHNTAICWPMRRNGCMRKSQTTTKT